MIICVAHSKGGVGKSTIATNLAVEFSAPLVDLDLQKSSYYFNNIRQAGGLSPLKIFLIPVKEEQREAELWKILKPYHGDKTAHIILDCAGMDNDILRAALVFSDLILTPVSASQIELLGLENFLSILREDGSEEDRKDYVLFNNFNPRGLREIAELEEHIRTNYGVRTMNARIAQRRIFKDAYLAGMSVPEADPQSPGAKDIRELVAEIRQIIAKE